MTSGATFSDDGVYRYRLWREWDADLPSCLFIMLNPSTADATQDDPTIRRCIDYARRWGFGRLEVGNLFALRSTDPKALYAADDPVGPDNDDALMEMHEGRASDGLRLGRPRTSPRPGRHGGDDAEPLPAAVAALPGPDQRRRAPPSALPAQDGNGTTLREMTRMTVEYQIDPQVMEAIDG